MAAKAEEVPPSKEDLVELLKALDLNTGDVVIFDRKCHLMSLYGNLICKCAKFLGQTQWDHNGVIIKATRKQINPLIQHHSSQITTTNDNESAEELFLMEANMSGVTLRPLIDRIERSKSHEIVVRKLQVDRTRENFQSRALEFVSQMIDSPYENRIQPLMNAGISVPSRTERERLFSLLAEKKKKMLAIQHHLEFRKNLHDFEKKRMEIEFRQIRQEYEVMAEELCNTDRSLFENEAKNTPSQPKRVFCSELVASFYQFLGILRPYPSSNSYLPKHFTSEQSVTDSQYLKFIKDVVLLPEISLRKELLESRRNSEMLVSESLCRNPQTQEEMNILLHSLRRHYLFSGFGEAALYKLAKKFTRKTFQDKEVVFYQGSKGDYFYIIEEGEFEVYVTEDSYFELGNLSNYEENRKNEKNIEDYSAVKKEATRSSLRRFASAPSGNERILVATHGPKIAFGESGVMYGTPRRATIQASSPSYRKEQDQAIVAWRISKEDFLEAVKSNPQSQKGLSERRFLLNCITHHPLFETLDNRAHAAVARKCFPLYFKKNTSIISQGDYGDYFYLIESGKCQISRKKPSQADSEPEKTIGPGESFGEASLLYNSRRGASVVALEDTKMWCLDRVSFLGLTRSGSTSLLIFFKKLCSTTINSEKFLSIEDFRKLFQFQSNSSFPPSVNDRVCNLATQLLFHKNRTRIGVGEDLVNFSQFAHFHILLEAESSPSKLLPTAAFKMLLSSSEESHNSSSEIAASLCVSDIDQAVLNWFKKNNVQIPDDLASIDDEESNAFYQNVFQNEKSVNIEEFTACLSSMTSNNKTLASKRFQFFLENVSNDLLGLRHFWKNSDFTSNSPMFQHKDVWNQDNFRYNWVAKLRGHVPRGVILPSFVDYYRDRDLTWSHFGSIFAAVLAGVGARTFTAPLERIKVLIQAPPITSTNLANGKQQVLIPIQSLRSGYYSGNLCHSLKLFPSFPIKLVMCDFYRGHLDEVEILESRLPAEVKNMFAGGWAGVSANTLLYPMEVVKGRLSTQQYPVIECVPTTKRYSGIGHCIRTMYAEEGIRAFYRGFTPSTFGSYTVIGLNYTIYQFLRPMMIKYNSETSEFSHPSVLGQLICASTAAWASQLVTYPLDVARRRMQLQSRSNWHPTMRWPTYANTWDCLKQTAGTGSSYLRVRRLYKGFAVNSLKILPTAVTSFYIYEKVKHNSM